MQISHACPGTSLRFVSSCWSCTATKTSARETSNLHALPTPLPEFFPKSVVQTTITLAQVHVLTEHLDHQMALHWMASQASHPTLDDAHRYAYCWRATGQAESRHRQLALVQQLGQDLAQLTRKPGLRSLLKMMRTPARAANLGALQDFLEAGFDAFAHIRGAEELLQQIAQRESHWINVLFSQALETSAVQLQRLLDTAELS